MSAVSREDLQIQHDRVSKELHGSVLPFWLKHSLDREFGGFFNCLDRDGKVWDTRKHVWLQGRQVWMMSKMYNTTGDARFLDAATVGADFLRKHAKTDGNRVHFCLTRDGKTVYTQRKIFSECFYVMAMAEYARATKRADIAAEARDVFASVMKFAKDATLVGRPVFEGVQPSSMLAVPMIILNLINELKEPGETTYAETEKWCVERMKLHIKPELKMVLEFVGEDGALLDSPEGRLLNPGHAIEAGWFLLEYATNIGDASLQKLGIAMMDWSFETGWDKEFDGILYFLDREGYSPSQLEWNMKLWWPHCEAMVGFLMAYQATGEERHFRRYLQVADYSFENFADPEFGEWFGYLDRYGTVTHRFKGGPYKGCFHVPRALFRCEGMLKELLAK